MTPDGQLDLGSGEEGVSLPVDVDEVVDAELNNAPVRRRRSVPLSLVG